MPLPTSGVLSWEMIRNEFGGGNPVYIDQYYRGNGRVPNIPENAGIPTSGPIYLHQFYGARAQGASPLSVTAPDVFNQVNNGTAAGSSVASGSGGTGGYTYTWVNNTSGASMGVNGASAAFSATRSVSGTATVTVRDSSGATATKTIYVDLTVGRPV